MAPFSKGVVRDAVLIVVAAVLVAVVLVPGPTALVTLEKVTGRLECCSMADATVDATLRWNDGWSTFIAERLTTWVMSSASDSPK